MDSNMFDDAYSHGTDNEGQTLSSGSYSSFRKRGPSKGPPSLPDGKKRSILTNEFGQPNEVDKNTSALSGSIGIQTRELLPIIYNEFSDIPDECYQRVLDALEKSYDLMYVAPTYLRDRISTAWRNNKHDLRMKYINGQDLATIKASEVPPFVPREDWLKFIDMSFSAKFLALSARNKANRKKLLSPNTLGRHSMAMIRHKIAKEKNLKSDAGVGRSEVYIRAHTKKDKTVQCPEIIEKIENIVKSNPEASKTSLNDALSQTLGKDSRGHMRGLGAGVSMTLFKSSSHIVEKNINLQMENNTTISMVEKLQRDMQELKDAFKKIQSTPHTGSNTSSPCSVDPVTQSILTQRLDTCNIGKACKVYSWPHVEVAEGEIVEVDPEVLVHHVAMGEGNYKIWLTRILDEKALLFKGDANVRTLEDVGRGGYLVWPKNFLEIET